MNGFISEEFNSSNIGLINRFHFIVDVTKRNNFKKILHVGCCDAINQQSVTCIQRKTLHDYLYEHENIEVIDGYDINAGAIERMRKKYPNSRFYTNIEAITCEYDLIVIPEVLEHVDNLKSFIDEMRTIRAKKIIVTVPSINRASSVLTIRSNGTYTEHVHSDHNVWFTPYTLSNIVRKFWGVEVEKIYLLGPVSVGVVF